MNIDFQFTTDMVIKDGDIAVVQHNDSIGQAIRDRLATFKREWFLDLDFGPDYRADILIKNPNINVVSAIIKEEILKTVDGTFTDFSLEQKPNRKFELTFTIAVEGGILTQTIII